MLINNGGRNLYFPAQSLQRYSCGPSVRQGPRAYPSKSHH